jgi:hypothetical protein
MQDWREEFNKRFTFDALKGSGDDGDLEVAAPRTNEIKDFITQLLVERDADLQRRAEAGERLAMEVRYSRPTYYPVTDMTSRPMDYVEKVNGAWIRWRDEQLAAYDAMVKGE